MDSEKVFRGRIVSVNASQRTVVVQPQKKVNGQWVDDTEKPSVVRKY